MFLLSIDGFFRGYLMMVMVMVMVLMVLMMMMMMIVFDKRRGVGGIISILNIIEA